MSDISISSGFLISCVRYCGGRTLAQPTPPLNGTRTSLQPNLPATYFKIRRKSLSKQGGKHISQPGLSKQRDWNNCIEVGQQFIKRYESKALIMIA